MLRSLFLLFCITTVANAQKLIIPSGELPTTGKRNSHLQSFDDLMISFIKENQIPGATLAVSRNGKLAYIRGYGYADLESKTPMQPDALFRIASISKPITAVAVLRLVEQRKLSLNDKVFAKLNYQPFIEKDIQPDPRVKEITIRQLLQHTAGFDSSKSFDPMFRSKQIAETLGVKSPAASGDVIRYMMGRPLDFSPGERYAYSNFGYCVLGRLIEAASSKPYEKYVQSEVLSKLGIRSMRIGKTLKSEKIQGEVTYYDPKERLVQSLFGKDKVPWAYGGWYLEAMDAHGGWIASAKDLVRFACDFDNPKKSILLKEKTISDMFACPDHALPKEEKHHEVWYGLGWSVREVSKGKVNTWHAGSLDGTETLLVRRSDGLNWAVLFNSRKEGKESLISKIDPLIHQAADAVKHWPSIDYFPSSK